MAQNISLTSGMQQNLYSLQQTNKLMDLTQSRLATGKRVQSALDDPINFFAAKEHNQRASDLASRKDSMGEAVQTIKAASAGIEAITDLINAAKSLAESAISENNTTTAQDLATQFSETMTQINNMAGDSGYKGENLLNGAALEIKFDEDGTNKLTVTGFDADNTGLGTGLALSTAQGTTNTNWASDNSAAVSETHIKSDIDLLDSAITLLRSEESKLSNNLSIITSRQDFTDSMINVLETGANDLTNADMNEEGANMLMLQTRQALGTSSLSIASQAAQAVLRLF